MYECEYSKEEINGRLLGILFVRKIWLFVTAFVMGFLVVGGVYLFDKTVVCDRTYMVENIYYVDYVDYKNMYYNYFTWETIADSDEYIDRLSVILGNEYTKEELIDATTITIESDVRYLYTRVVTTSSQESVIISQAMEKALKDYVDSHNDIIELRLENAGEAYDNSNIRTLNAALLGGTLEALAVMFLWLFKAITRTVFYLPSELEKRYHYPVIGCKSMPEFGENIDNFIDKNKNNALVFAGNVSDLADLGLEQCNMKVFGNPIEEVGNISAIKECDALYLAVSAKNMPGYYLERIIGQLARNGIAINAFIFYNEDEKLIKAYYRK